MKGYYLSSDNRTLNDEDSDEYHVNDPFDVANHYQFEHRSMPVKQFSDQRALVLAQLDSYCNISERDFRGLYNLQTTGEQYRDSEYDPVHSTLCTVPVAGLGEYMLWRRPNNSFLYVGPPYEETIKLRMLGEQVLTEAPFYKVRRSYQHYGEYDLVIGGVDPIYELQSLDDNGYYIVPDLLTDSQYYLLSYAFEQLFRIRTINNNVFIIGFHFRAKYRDSVLNHWTIQQNVPSTLTDYLKQDIDRYPKLNKRQLTKLTIQWNL